MATDQSKIIRRKVLVPTEALAIRFPVYYIQISDGYTFEDDYGTITMNFESPLRMSFFYDEYTELYYILSTKFRDNNPLYEEDEAKIYLTLDNDEPIVAFMRSKRVNAIDIYSSAVSNRDAMGESRLNIAGRRYRHFRSLINRSADQNTQGVFDTITSRYAYHILYGDYETLTSTVSIPVQWQTEYQEAPFEDTFDIVVT